MKIIEEVKKYYRSNNEYYHTIHHVEKMLTLMNLNWRFFVEEYPEYSKSKEDMELAIGYHDCVYIPGKKDNEIESAKIFLSVYPNNVFVKDAIISTTVGAEQKNGFEKFLHDLDWVGFLDYDIMKSNEDKIYKEFVEIGGFSKEDCEKGQLSFYKWMVGKSIYHTKIFRLYNDVTQDNIKRRIKEMSNENI